MPTPATCSAGPGGTEAADEHRAINRGPSTGHRSGIVEPAGIADAPAGLAATPPPKARPTSAATSLLHLVHRLHTVVSQWLLRGSSDWTRADARCSLPIAHRFVPDRNDRRANPDPDPRNPSDWPQARPHLGAPNLRGPELGCLPIPLLVLPAPLGRPLGTRPRYLIPGSHAHLRGPMLPGDARRPLQVGREAYLPLEAEFPRKFTSPGVPPFHQPGIHLCIEFTEEVIAGRASR